MQTQTERTVAPRTKKLVLVAEDDPMLRQTVMMMLELLGADVVGAESGDELLAWVEPLLLLEDHGQSPDVVLTDVMMPGISALEVVEGLMHVGRGVPVIVMSGLDDAGTKNHVRALGYAWIDKPLAPRVFEGVIRQALARSYARP